MNKHTIYCKNTGHKNIIKKWKFSLIQTKKFKFTIKIDQTTLMPLLPLFFVITRLYRNLFGNWIVMRLLFAYVVHRTIFFYFNYESHFYLTFFFIYHCRIFESISIFGFYYDFVLIGCFRSIKIKINLFMVPLSPECKLKKKNMKSHEINIKK